MVSGGHSDLRPQAGNTSLDRATTETLSRGPALDLALFSRRSSWVGVGSLGRGCVPARLAGGGESMCTARAAMRANYPVALTMSSQSSPARRFSGTAWPASASMWSGSRSVRHPLPARSWTSRRPLECRGGDGVQAHRVSTGALRERARPRRTGASRREVREWPTRRTPRRIRKATSKSYDTPIHRG